MLRFTEIALFLVPFALYVAWRMMGPRTPKWFMWASAGAIGVLAAGAVWFGLTSHLQSGDTYAPAHLENGRIVQGHGVPKAAP
jgi:hypothetical protein